MKEPEHKARMYGIRKSQVYDISTNHVPSTERRKASTQIMNTPLRVAVHCGALQCVAVCCSVLQCAVVRCSMLQCVAALRHLNDKERASKKPMRRSKPQLHFVTPKALTTTCTCGAKDMPSHIAKTRAKKNSVQLSATHCTHCERKKTQCNTLQHTATLCNTLPKPSLPPVPAVPKK